MISVIMSVYNESAQEISKAIESIINQYYKDFEFIIILDNPLNIRAIETIENYKNMDSRIVFLKNDHNMGLASSLNRCLEKAKGDFIARMDADDISLPHRFSVEVEFLTNNPSIDVVSSNIINIDENDKKILTKRVICENSKDMNRMLKYDNIISHPTVLMRKEAILSCDGYRDFKASQDYDLWLRMRKKGFRFSIIKEPLLLYRIRNNSVSRSDPGQQLACHMYALYLDKMEDSNSNLFSLEAQNKYSKKLMLYSTYDRMRYKRALTLYLKGLDSLHSGDIFKASLLILRGLTIHKLFLRRATEMVLFQLYSYKYMVTSFKCTQPDIN